MLPHWAPWSPQCFCRRCLAMVQATSLISSPKEQCWSALLLQPLVQGLWKTDTPLIHLPFKVEINESVLHFFLLFPIPLCAVSPLSPSPWTSLEFGSQQVTQNWQHHSLSVFLLPGIPAPQHISNPASELSGDTFGFTFYLWLSVGLSLFFWVFKYF